MQDRDIAALAFLAGACFALLMYRTIEDVADMMVDAAHALRSPARPRVQWHVFGGENTASAADAFTAGKDAAPVAETSSGHAKAVRP